MLTAALALAAAVACPPLEGADRLWAQASTRFVVVGEMHGTAQTPAIFGDLVCNAAASRRPIIVALEVPVSEQPAIDRFLASDGGGAARAAFLTASFWAGPLHDGRSSKAYFELIDRLRGMKARGEIAAVAAFQPVQTLGASQSAYNAAMAERLEAALAVRPDGLLLALVGNIHARKLPMKIAGETIVPAAADLPADRTIALNTPAGGEAWNCRTRTDCGPHALSRAMRPPRRVVLDRMIDPAYDGEVQLGAPTTASPPATDDKS